MSLLLTVAWCSSYHKFHLCSGLFQSLLLAPCDVDGGSGLGQLEAIPLPIPLEAPVTTHTQPDKDIFPGGRTQHHMQSAVSQKPACNSKGERLSRGLCWLNMITDQLGDTILKLQHKVAHPLSIVQLELLDESYTTPLSSHCYSTSSMSS